MTANHDEILAPQDIEEMRALDGDIAVSPMSGQAALFQSYYDVLKPLIMQFIATTPELTFTKVPNNISECLFFINALCLTWPHIPAQEARSILRKADALDNTAFKLLTDGRYEKILRLSTELDEKSSQYIYAESFKETPDIGFDDITRLIYVSEQKIRARTEALPDSNQKNHSRALVKWNEFAESIIEAQICRLAILKESFNRAFPNGRG